MTCEFLDCYMTSIIARFAPHGHFSVSFTLIVAPTTKDALHSLTYFNSQFLCYVQEVLLFPAMKPQDEPLNKERYKIQAYYYLSGGISFSSIWFS